MADRDPRDAKPEDVLAAAEAEGAAGSEAAAGTPPKVVTPKAKTSTRKRSLSCCRTWALSRLPLC